MFASSLGKSIAPFLEPGEALLGAVMAQAAGANLQLLARRMVLAITTRRLLIFRMGGAFSPKAKALLGERPIADVHQTAVSKGVSTKAVTLHVAGTAFGVETARGQPAEVLPHALLRAQAMA